jgi:hypothetical protein
VDEFELDVGVAEHEAVGCFFGYPAGLFGACVEACVGFVPCGVGVKPWVKRGEGEPQGLPCIR